MSELIRSLLPRLLSGAIPNDYIDERSLGDVVQRQYGNPEEPTAIAQLREKAEGKSSRIQLDR
jgi:hypothetical protein